MRNDYIIAVVTSVDIQEIVKVEGKVVEICEGVVYRETLKVSPFKNVMEKLFASRQKGKDEGKDSMQSSVKLITNSLYGVQIRKNDNDFNKCKSEHWMQTEYDDNVLDWWKISNGTYIRKIK